MNIVEVTDECIRNGRAKSKNYTGMKFGRLTILGLSDEYKIDSKGGKHLLWVCRCDCGNVVQKTSHDFSYSSRKVPSCGCYMSDMARGLFTKHGATLNRNTERLYVVWNGIKQRCLNPNNQYYGAYGGRGITICNEWKTDYTAFKEWAYDNGYDENASSQQCTIDRIDVNKGYFPENCRWVSAKEQSVNRTNNRILEYLGEKHTVSEWSEIVGLPQGTLNGRLNRYGWSVEDALSLPKHSRRCNKIDKEKENGTSA